MTDDKTLLELAAKAAGIKHSGQKGGSGLWIGHGNIFEGDFHSPRWNPLTDDGDALRLAVKLHLDVFNYWPDKEQENPDLVEVIGSNKIVRVSVNESLSINPCAETRRAIVRAAAEIGKSMP